MERRHRRQEDDRYKDEWFSQQCGMCRYFVKLTGPLGLDYGACTNPGSAFDRHIMFEHDGCEKFSQADEWA